MRHRLTFMLLQLRHRSSRLSDIRVAIYGPAALTALARRSGELQHALPNLIQRNDGRAIRAHLGPFELPKGAVP
jgi:hypothetical protein